MMQNFLLIISCGLIIALGFMYFFCEFLIRRERKKAERNRVHYYKSADGSSGGDDGDTKNLIGESHQPENSVAAASVRGGYVILPLSRRKGQNEEADKSNAASAPAEDKIKGENPRSDDAWKKDSGNESSFADRKEDPWVCKKAIVAAPISTSKPEAKATEEGTLEQSAKTASNTAVSDATAVAATGIMIGATAEEQQLRPKGSEIIDISTIASIEPPPATNQISEGMKTVDPSPPPVFSTAGFWEAQEAAKQAASGSSSGGGFFSNGYDGAGSSSGGWNDSSGGGGFGNDASSYGGWGNDISGGISEKTGWGADTSDTF